jgi:hypothetical protein
VLKDGGVLYSFGDYAEVGRQLTFSLPMEDSESPHVQVVSLPLAAVDLDATHSASQSVRAARYVLTSGPKDFADLSQEVSNALSSIPVQRDPTVRVAIVEGVRRRLMEWPASHFGYRANDVNDAISMLDPILVQLRSAAGVHAVDLSLVAPTTAPVSMPTFRQPGLIDLIENAMRVVTWLVPEERTAVLHATAASLVSHRAELPSFWLSTTERRVDTALKSERQVDDAYRRLSAEIIGSASRAATAGNVRAISTLQHELMERDRRLGGSRRDVVLSTIDALRAHSEAAAHVQLSREREAMSVEAVRAYAGDIASALKRFDTVKPALLHVDRAMTESAWKAQARYTLESVRRSLLQCPPPPEVNDAHTLLLTAAYLAALALQDDIDPQISREMAGTVRASAATESLLMFDRGKREIDAALKLR